VRPRAGDRRAHPLTAVLRCHSQSCVSCATPAELAFWRDFAARFVRAACAHPGAIGLRTPLPALAPADLDDLAAGAPPMTGAEYLSTPVLQALWRAADAAFRSQLVESKESVCSRCCCRCNGRRQSVSGCGPWAAEPSQHGIEHQVEVLAHILREVAEWPKAAVC
jgi:hypothetical protein